MYFSKEQLYDCFDNRSFSLNAITYLIISRIKSRKLYNVVSISVVALCVTVIIVATSLSNGFENTLMSKIVVASPHVTVYSSDDLLKLPDKNDILYNLRMAQVQALAINPENKIVQGVVLRGTLPEDIKKLFNNVNVLIEGHYPEEGEVIIGSNLAKNCNINLADTLKIITGPAISTELKVSGIFKVGLFDFDSTVIVASYRDVIALSPEEGEGIASKVDVFNAIWLKNPFLASKYAKLLLSSYPNLSVSNWMDDNKTLFSAINLEKIMIFLVLMLLVIAASVAIANSQFIQIISQQEQIALLSAMGFSPRKICIVFILEALFIALIGSIVGIFLALMIVYYLSHYPVNLPMDVYQVSTVPVKLDNFDVFITILFTLIIMALSALVPALYASRLDPVEILRRI